MDVASWLPQLSWVDWALLAVLAISVLAGLMRGFVFECLALAGWIVAWFVAQWAAPHLAPHLPTGMAGPAMLKAIAFALCFFGVLIVWSLLAKGVRMLIHATPLALPDRLLGGVFGGLRGAVLLLVVATVVGLTPAAQSSGWRASRGASWLQQTLTVMKLYLPEPAARLLRASAHAARLSRT